MGKRMQQGSCSTYDAEAGVRLHHHHQPVSPIPPEAAFVSWLVPAFVMGNLVAFAYTMYVNDCPGSSLASRSGQQCILEDFLGRFAFEPLLVNPLFGPTTQTNYHSKWLADKILFKIVTQVLFSKFSR